MKTNKNNRLYNYDEAVSKFLSIDDIMNRDKDKDNAREKALNSLQEFSERLKMD